MVLEKITPKAVIVASIEAKIITDREMWMNALDDRNRMSHVYSDSAFAEVVENIEKKYLSLFDALYEKLFDDLMNNAGLKPSITGFLRLNSQPLEVFWLLAVKTLRASESLVLVPMATTKHILM